MNMLKMTRLYFNTDGGAAGAGAAAATTTGTQPGPTTTTTQPPAGGGATGTPPPASSQEWTSGLDEIGKGYVQNKGWKAPGDVLHSYQNLEKAIGVPPERLLHLPKDDNADEWGKIYGRLGKPEKADGYNIPMPKEGGSEDFAKWAKEAFHGANLTTKQAEALAGKWNEYMGNTAKAELDGYQAKVQTESAALKTEWGQAYDQNVDVAKNAAKTFGVSGDEFEGLEKTLGYKNTIKLFQKIGAGLGEGKFIGGDGGNKPHILTPGQAMAKLSELKNDRAWADRYSKGDAAAKAEVANLLAMANPEQK